MPVVLRIILFVGALLTSIHVLRNIRKSKMRSEDSVFWILSSLVLVLLAVFPELAISLSQIMQFESPSNMVFLIVIFLLIIRTFTQDRKISRLQIQIMQMAQKEAVDHLTLQEEEGKLKEEASKD